MEPPPLVSLLLDSSIEWGQFKSWLTQDLGEQNEAEANPSLSIPSQIASKFSPSALSQLRPEIGLAVINFIRDQIYRILDESQKCYQTPLKPKLAANVGNGGTPGRPGKYDYSSPVKPLAKANNVNIQKTSSAGPSDAKAKKRGQLQLNVNKDNSSPRLETTSASPLKNSFRTQDDRRRLNDLEERFNGPQAELGKRGKNGQENPSKAGQGRRSLDSELAASSASRGGTRAARMPPSPTNLNLGDFLVPAKKQSGSKNKKKKGRSSMGSPQPYIPGLTIPSPEPSTIEVTSKRKTRSLSPTATKRAVTINFDNLDDPASDDKGAGDATAEAPKPLAKITTEYKEQFDNAGLWSIIAKGFENSEDPCAPKSIETAATPLKKAATPAKNTPAKLPQVAATPSKGDEPGHSGDFVTADPALVSRTAELDKLVRLYSFCLERNLVPNILAELYLVVELLTIQESILEANNSAEETNYLDSVHNCVYFACKFLRENSGLLKNLDSLTLELMTKNPRISCFSEELKDLVEKFKEAREASPKRKKPSGKKSSEGLETVRFNIATDSNSNFPSDKSFQDFKKQRDLFYNIVRTWHPEYAAFSAANAFNDTRSFHVKFGESVDKLVALNKSPVNLIHLARLVRDQMVTTCLAEVFEKSGEDVLSLEKKADPAKLRQLHSRFCPTVHDNSDEVDGQCPNTTFEGSQLFYRDFLEHCDNFAFTTHLKNALIESITEKNRESFDAEATQLTDVICTLRLLAKFLGLIESQPFRGQASALPGDILDTHIKLREQEPPSMDLTAILCDAVRSKRLVITLPWIVEYCSVLDQISLQSGYYQRLISHLVLIYRLVLPDHKPLYSMDRTNALLLRLLAGQLFENPLVPRELFFNDEARSRRGLEELVGDRVMPGSSSGGEKSLDERKVLTSGILYSCCPFLSELKRLLSQFQAGKKLHGDVVTSNQLRKQQSQVAKATGRRVALSGGGGGSQTFAPTKVEDDKEKEINTFLEEQLFHNQHESIKKYLDLVLTSSRSSLIIHVLEKIIPMEIEKMSDTIREKAVVAMTLMGDGGDDSNDDPVFKQEAEHIKADVQAEVNKMAALSCNHVLKSARAFFQKEWESGYELALETLLPQNLSNEVRGNLLKLAATAASKKVTLWAKQQVTIGYFVNKYQRRLSQFWSLGLRNLQASSAKMKAKVCNSIPAATSQVSTSVMIHFKLLPFNVLNGSASSMELDPAELLALLQTVEQNASNAPDIAVKEIGSESVALALALITKNPASMTPEVQMSLIRLWQGCLRYTDDVSCILSPMTLPILARSRQPRATWNKMEAFVGRLLKHELLLPMTFEGMCIELLRHEWPKALLSYVASCLRSVVDSHRRESSPNAADFADLLDWIIWFFQDAEDEFEMNFPKL